MTTGTNQFLAFATGTGANVYSNSAYAGLTARMTGVVDGIADGPTFNSAWRQGTSVAAMVGAFIAAHGFDALDDGDISALRSNFEAALGVLISAGLSTLPSTSFVHYGSDAGAANALVVDVVPSITSYADGHIFEITPAHTTTTTTPTVNIDGVGVKSIVRPDGTALMAGEIMQGAKALFAYDSALGKVVLLGVSKPYVDAAVAGVSTSGTLVNVQTFSASGTYTRSAGVTAAVAYVVSGGGGGGGCPAGSNNVMAGGGGGGEVRLVKFAPSATHTITVGAGGTGVANANGNAGGASSIGGGVCTANGGLGGKSSGNGSGGGSAGTGGTGGAALGASRGGGNYGSLGQGMGGGNTFGPGAPPQHTSPGAGIPGETPGAGGSGANGNNNTGGALAGGNGAGGIVIIWEYK